MAVTEYTKGVPVQLSAHFVSTEFDCKCGRCKGKTKIDLELIQWLEGIRRALGVPITISSGYRCVTHNSNVGGVVNSDHTKGKAVDIYASGVTSKNVARYAEAAGARGILWYPNSGFVHLDVRKNKYFCDYQNGVRYNSFGITGIVIPDVEVTTPPADVVTGYEALPEYNIWQYFRSQGLTAAGTAGLMGNLYHESSLVSTNTEQSKEGKLQYINEEYAKATDDGRYTNFVYDMVGFGLAQWTVKERKGPLLEYAKSQGVSVGNFDMQLRFLMSELQSKYSGVLQVLKTTNDVRTASNKVLIEFEVPERRFETSVQNQRASTSQKYYNQFNNMIFNYQDPPSINIVEKTSTANTNYVGNRDVKFIVIHYTAGYNSNAGSAINTANYFARPDTKASADFIVDDETIVQFTPDVKKYYTWHCGGSTPAGKYDIVCSNANSIGIEICSTFSGGTITNSTPANIPEWSFTDAVLNQAALLVRYLMATYNIDIDHVIRHYDVIGKQCPGIIGWNEDSGDTSKWLDFKQKISSISAASGSLGNPVTATSSTEYAARVIVPEGRVLNCYASPSTESEIVKTYVRNDIVVVTKSESGWHYVQSGWVDSWYLEKVSASEAMISLLLSGYDGLVYDSTTGKLLYPMEGWYEMTGGGFKFFSKDTIFDMLFKIRGQEVEESGEIALSNEEFAKRLIFALESGSTNLEECEEKIRLVLKSAATTQAQLVASPKIQVRPMAADPMNDVSEEFILEKLDNNKDQILEYFKRTYNDEGWNRNIQEAPEKLNFWFDFMNTNGDMGKYAVKAIGSRPKAINDDKIKAIYFQETPNVLFLTPEQHQELIDNREDYVDMTGYTFVKLQPFMENYFTISSQGKSAKDELDTLLYNHTHATESTTLTSVPIYHLQPNTRVFIKDDNTGINGEYIVSKVTIPLQYNGTTSITTTKAVERIY